jgi:hypothetical protein
LLGAQYSDSSFGYPVRIIIGDYLAELVGLEVSCKCILGASPAPYSAFQFSSVAGADFGLASKQVAPNTVVVGGQLPEACSLPTAAASLWRADVGARGRVGGWLAAEHEPRRVLEPGRLSCSAGAKFTGTAWQRAILGFGLGLGAPVLLAIGRLAVCGAILVIVVAPTKESSFT